MFGKPALNSQIQRDTDYPYAHTYTLSNMPTVRISPEPYVL